MLSSTQEAQNDVMHLEPVMLARNVRVAQALRVTSKRHLKLLQLRNLTTPHTSNMSHQALTKNRSNITKRKQKDTGCSPSQEQKHTHQSQRTNPHMGDNSQPVMQPSTNQLSARCIKEHAKTFVETCKQQDKSELVFENQDGSRTPGAECDSTTNLPPLKRSKNNTSTTQIENASYHPSIEQRTSVSRQLFQTPCLHEKTMMYEKYKLTATNKLCLDLNEHSNKQTITNHNNRITNNYQFTEMTPLPEQGTACLRCMREYNTWKYLLFFLRSQMPISKSKLANLLSHFACSCYAKEASRLQSEPADSNTAMNSTLQEGCISGHHLSPCYLKCSIIDDELTPQYLMQPTEHGNKHSDELHVNKVNISERASHYCENNSMDDAIWESDGEDVSLPVSSTDREVWANSIANVKSKNHSHLIARWSPYLSRAGASRISPETIGLRNHLNRNNISLTANCKLKFPIHSTGSHVQTVTVAGSKQSLSDLNPLADVCMTSTTSSSPQVVRAAATSQKHRDSTKLDAQTLSQSERREFAESCQWFQDLLRGEIENRDGHASEKPVVCLGNLDVLGFLEVEATPPQNSSISVHEDVYKIPPGSSVFVVDRGPQPFQLMNRCIKLLLEAKDDEHIVSDKCIAGLENIVHNIRHILQPFLSQLDTPDFAFDGSYMNL
eukprot:gene6151-7402_t